MSTYADSIKDVLMIILIVSGAGALKQVYVDSGVSASTGRSIHTIANAPLIAWMADQRNHSCCHGIGYGSRTHHSRHHRTLW